MDTDAYLRKHGWRGTGHSLDSNNAGLKKPLLISKKIDVLGIGINKHDVVADQWWMKAFDSSLKDFGTGKKSILSNVKDHGIKRGGLYGRFVQGEGMPGSIGIEICPSDKSNLVIAPAVEAVEIEQRSSKKQKKRKAGEGDKDEKKERKRKKYDKDARRAAKIAKREAKAETDVETRATDGTTTESDTKAARKSTKQKKEKTIESLDAEKRKEYEQRAKAKGQTLEDYFSRRQEKNKAARSS
ncbi:hypothetical protein BDV97DRAFT_299422 [Delphinella strobiligena]|nr:hypothetical protein BDV97DRAFT_299422 [Delphinella strobiligena]